MNINAHRLYLSESTFQHLANSALALERLEYFSSAIWGAVFLESFLADLSVQLKLPKSGQDDLNGRIQQLRQYCKNNNEVYIPDDIVKRCDDIRGTRNRLVHDTGLSKMTLEQDAKFIYAGIEVIINWYKTIAKLNESTQGIDLAVIQPSKKAKVFLSTITPHKYEQEYFINNVCYKLENMGIEVVRATLSFYDKKDPISKIRTTIDKCDAALIIGLERSHAYFIREKEGALEQSDEMHKKYTSGWLHLEAGIANALGKEIFILCQHDICSDGIFDRSWNSYPVAVINSLAEDSHELNEFLDFIQHWLDNR